MIAGEVVQLPRSGDYRCVGCRRWVAIASTVALDLPNKTWLIVCFDCYSAEIVGEWLNFPLIWNGDAWLSKPESIPLPNERERAAGLMLLGLSCPNEHKLECRKSDLISLPSGERS